MVRLFAMEYYAALAMMIRLVFTEMEKRIPVSM